MTPDRGPGRSVGGVALTIGALADAAGIGVETVRFYERRGLLPSPPRTPAGYRQYSEADVWRLGLIARGKALGFTLAEIAALLGEASATAATSAEEVRRAAAAKIDVVDEQVRQLADVRARLERMVATCDEGDAEGCASLATSCR